MARPTVSVVIPCHNGAAFVADAIRSVLAQTQPPAEVIVVNDGSTDDSLTVIQEAIRDAAVRADVITQPNRGLAAARNAGASIATGEWLAFLDADDTWLPTKLERQLELVKPGIDLVHTDRFNVGYKGALPDIQSTMQPLYEGDAYRDLLIANHISASSVIILRSRFEALGGFDASLHTGAEDWDLWLRVAEQSAIAAVHEPLIKYRFHQSNMSSNPALMRDSRNDVIDRALRRPAGRRLDASTRRWVRSRVELTNANDAAKRGARWLALKCYVKAALLSPLKHLVAHKQGAYADLVRLALGRKGWS